MRYASLRFVDVQRMASMSVSSTTLRGNLADLDTRNELENPRGCPSQGLGRAAEAMPLMTRRHGPREAAGNEDTVVSPMVSND